MKTKNTKPNTIDIKRFIKAKECLTESGKRKLLHALHLYKELQEPMWISEDGMMDRPERNVIAKTFDTKADFDSYVNQRRGIQMTPKEQQSILSYTETKPTQRDHFFVKFETTDDFGNNETTIIKKLREGNQFCWTAFTKHESAEEEGGGESEGPEDKEDDKGKDDTDLEDKLGLKELAPAAPNAQPTQQPQPQPQQTPQPQPTPQQTAPAEDDEMTVDDPIRITKTITFVDDNEGSCILSDFLQKLDI